MLTNPLFSWPRPRFERGGGDARLFFEIYGEFSGLELEISRARHNSNGLPVGVEARVLPANLAHWDGAIGDLMRESNPQSYEIARTAPQMMRIQGEVADPSNLDYLRDTVGAIAALLENGGAAVLDPQILTLFRADDWLATFFDDPFEPTKHAVILASPDGESGEFWLHTRGMRLFGRPDISCHRVAPPDLEPLQTVFNGLIRMQAAGARIPENQFVFGHGLGNRLICQHRGDLDDPQFNNVHLELIWEGR